MHTRSREMRNHCKNGVSPKAENVVFGHATRAEMRAKMHGPQKGQLHAITNALHPPHVSKKPNKGRFQLPLCAPTSEYTILALAAPLSPAGVPNLSLKSAAISVLCAVGREKASPKKSGSPKSCPTTPKAFPKQAMHSECAGASSPNARIQAGPGLAAAVRRKVL